MERIEFKAAITVDETGAIEGMAWPFGSADRVGDDMLPGSFKSAKAPLPMLAYHDTAQPVGVWDSITETAKGLVVKGRLLVGEVAKAGELRALIMAKAITGLSIGFVTKSAVTRAGGGRTIKSVDLLEISLVAVPAHPHARITSAKGATTLDNPEQGAAPEIAALEQKIGALDATVKGITMPDLKPITDRLDAIETKQNRPGGDGKQTDEAAAVEKKAWLNYLRRGQQTDDVELKTLTVANDQQAGYLAPAEVSRDMIRDITEISPIRQYATVRQSMAPSVKYPKRNSITNAKWEGETETSEESNVTVGQKEIVSKRLTTYVDISNSLLMGSDGTAEAEVRTAFSEDFALKEGRAFVSGDGLKEPEGILTNADITSLANGHISTVSTDKLIDLMYGLKGVYRRRGVWLMNSTTIAVIRKLKNGTTGEYLWQPALQAGQPDTLLGRPILDVVDWPDIAENAFPIAFGDLATAYRIVDRQQLATLTDPYTQAKNAITRIHATSWVGGGVVQPLAIKKLKMSAS